MGSIILPDGSAAPNQEAALEEKVAVCNVIVNAPTLPTINLAGIEYKDAKPLVLAIHVTPLYITLLVREAQMPEAQKALDSHRAFTETALIDLTQTIQEKMRELQFGLAAHVNDSLGGESFLQETLVESELPSS